MSYLTVGVGSNPIIERQIVTGAAVASVTFSTGIDGDVDRYYRLLFRLYRTSTMTELYLQPNSITTGHVSKRTTMESSATTYAFPVIATPLSNGFSFGEVLYDAVTGRVRSYISVGGIQGQNTPVANNQFNRSFAGSWRDVSTNITSFRLISDDGSAGIDIGSEFILSKTLPV
jgi:hypothetical protein